VGRGVVIIALLTGVLSFTLEIGREATVARVPDGDAELLRYLADIQLVPGQPVTIVQAAPFRGPLTIQVAGRDVAIVNELAARIGVSI
jgi:DtxR family transcriptional regulator, Mn-dependent transcriptional regulator